MTAVVLPPPPVAMSEQERFFRYFQSEVTALQEQMRIIEDHGTSGGERADAIDHCLAGISKLSNEVKDISGSLPAHDQRTYSEAIKALSEKLQKVRSLAAPKPRFTFKSSFVKKNASAISITDAAELASTARRRIPKAFSTDTSSCSSFATTPAELMTPASEDITIADDSNETSIPDFGPKTGDAGTVRKPSFSKSTSVSISNHSGVHIMLPYSAAHATTSGTVANLRRCVVDMSISTASAFAGLTLKNIRDSVIICGRVSGAVHITDVKNSVLVVATRQFRMHESSNVDVYLHCGSRPIIEACKEVHFAPLPDRYANEADAKVTNQFDQVDDFKWLKAEHSPHWSVLDMPHRVQDDVWRDVVPGGPSIGLEDILKATKVPGLA